VERTRPHNLAVGSVCKLRAETLPTQPPRHPLQIPDCVYAGLLGNKYPTVTQGPADAAAAAVRQKQPVSKVAMDVQVRLHVQLGETGERYRMMMSRISQRSL